MSILNYLKQKASDAVLSEDEKESINISISFLQERLETYFNSDIEDYFIFGSYKRETILPRFMDENSDIDFMVIFSDNSHAPNTYLTWLKDFAEHNYSRSEIYRASPSIVLELNHIKFDLVPAIINLDFFGFQNGYKIPDKTGKWLTTDPNDFNNKLIRKNKDNYNLIKPTIRLIKYWNVDNNYIFDSFELEKWIIDQFLYSFFSNNLQSYLFKVFDILQPNNSQTKEMREKIERAKKIIEKARYYERRNEKDNAEEEIYKLIPYE